MKKKEYYKKIKRYNQLICERDFNFSFFQKEEFEELRTALMLQVHKFIKFTVDEKILVTECFLSNANDKNFNKLRKICAKRKQLEKILELLECNEVVKDYDGTYCGCISLEAICLFFLGSLYLICIILLII